MLPFELTKDTPYLALSGELWSVFYEYFNRNWPCYKGFLLYAAQGGDELIMVPVIIINGVGKFKSRQTDYKISHVLFKVLLDDKLCYDNLLGTGFGVQNI